MYPKFHKGSVNPVYMQLTGTGEMIAHDAYSYTHNALCLCVNCLYDDCQPAPQDQQC